MNLQRALRLLLTGALLVTWQAALVHPIEHVGAGGEFVHLAGGYAADGSGKKSAPDARCDALAAVAACVNGPLRPVFAVSGGVAARLQHRADEFRSAPLLAYRSQAPPSLL